MIPLKQTFVNRDFVISAKNLFLFKVMQSLFFPSLRQIPAKFPSSLDISCINTV
ncbi:hypothetical protein BACCAP_00145 [Pseudoflavonifractor capillosus ATCC 29799]|uniref:Uncharacterized protein n=1 Tax=Pseudoflavonifractor capillosus ATCC 29799 TaxID=411467 RepID=A6NPM9_9FIRM|nr:hypothetical protein BACCAP_00145 [Pseudoflavonifractor capillosus ATCC 29799]